MSLTLCSALILLDHALAFLQNSFTTYLRKLVQRCVSMRIYSMRVISMVGFKFDYDLLNYKLPIKS